MILKQPKFWNSKFNLYSLFLLPLTFLYFILIKINEFLKKLSKKKLNLKIICCGNILIGGTGKTPLTVMIYNELSKEQKCCTIKKHRTEHLDEINFLKKYTKLFSNKDRLLSLKQAENEGCQYAILDDGSQDYSFEKNINILCIKSKNGFGNEYLLPSGPLREPMTKIKNYKFAIINGKLNTKIEDRLKKFNKNIDIYYSKYEIENKENYLNKKYLAFCGIANNTDFFDLLEKSQIKVIIKKEFPDHHAYNEFEINELLKMAKNHNLEIITTEKDHCRLNKDFAIKVQYLKLKLEIENYQQFLKNLKNEIN
jgi:tetraacyldisaccharide 4'-kinase